MARKKPFADPNGSVVAIAVDGARKLLTIEPTAACWKEGARLPSAKGAIVRLRPAADATDEAIDSLRRAFEARGAARVTVLPRPRAEVLPEKVMENAERPPTPREAVLALVEESNSKDRKALGRLAEQIMAEAGL